MIVQALNRMCKAMRLVLIGFNRGYGLYFLASFDGGCLKNMWERSINAQTNTIIRHRNMTINERYAMTTTRTIASWRWSFKPLRDLRSTGRACSLNRRSRLNALCVLAGLLVITLHASPVLADLKVTNVFYAWDEPQSLFQNSKATISFNGSWEQLFHQLTFDTDLFDTRQFVDGNSNPTGAVCDGSNGTYTTQWAGIIELTVYNEDNNPAGAPGFQETRDWELALCDRNQNGQGIEGGQGDLGTPPARDDRYIVDKTSLDTDAYLGNTSFGYPAASSVSPSGFIVTTSALKDVVRDPCPSGNCQKELITTLYINLDKDCDGSIDEPIATTVLKGYVPGDNKGPGLCFFAEARKPPPSTPSWGGNLQARIEAGGGAKTVNFSGTPTVAVVSSFDAYAEGGRVVLEWETSSEIGTAGFYVERLDDKGEAVRITDNLLPAKPYAPRGERYRYVDDGAQVGGQYTYQLVEVETNGHTVTYGPYTVTASQSGPVAEYAQSNSDAVFGDSSTFSSSANLPTQAEIRRAENARQARQHGQGNNAVTTNSTTLSVNSGLDSARIEVTDSGIYFVTASDISAALGLGNNKLNTLLNTGGLRLTNKGMEVAWIPASHGEGLYFYGQSADSLYTDKNVYWLEVGDGTVMTIEKGQPPKASAQGGTYVAHEHVEKDLTLDPFIVKDPDSDFWFWDYVGSVGSGSKTFTVPTPGAVTNGSAELTVHLQGVYDVVPGNDNRAVIYVNGTQVGEGEFDSQAPFALKATFDQGLLSDGDNQIKVVDSPITGVPYNGIYIDSFDVSYTRSYRADGNSLTFDASNRNQVAVAGFSSPNIDIFDVTDPNKPEYYKPNALSVEQDGSGYVVEFYPVDKTGRYVALASDSILSPASVAADAPSDLRSTQNAADYLVITPASLAQGAQALAGYRSAHGLTATVVYLQDIYDEFSYGMVDPYAIRDFLTYAYKNWSKAPKFVVLAGNGTMDQKDRLGYGTSLVPILLASTTYGLFPADTRFADVVGGDGSPEYALGRIPVLSSQELSSYVDKVKAYESNPDPNWLNHALLLADNPDNGGDFYAESDAVGNSLPARFSITKTYYAAGQDKTTFRQTVLDSLNGDIGVGFFNYVGHGGSSQLGSEGFLTLGDISELTNVTRTPVFVAMTCGVGDSAYPGYDSLVQRLLVHDRGGAVAAVAPTGLSFSDQASKLNTALVRAMYGNSPAGSLGQAFVTALQSPDVDLKNDTFRTYSVFGDPALQLNMR